MFDNRHATTYRLNESGFHLVYRDNCISSLRHIATAKYPSDVANQSRLTGVIGHDSKVLTCNDASGLSNSISRLLL